MFKSHIKITASAENIEQLKQALINIIKRLDHDELTTYFHDDYEYSYETFDNETLITFGIKPENFLFSDLPSNL
jgi:hypothetical protein